MPVLSSKAMRLRIFGSEAKRVMEARVTGSKTKLAPVNCRLGEIKEGFIPSLDSTQLCNSRCWLR